MKKNRIFTAAAITIFPLTALWAQSPRLDSGNGAEDASDRAFEYISQAREAREVAVSKTTPPPAVQRQSRKEILDFLGRVLATCDMSRGVVVTVLPSEYQAVICRPEIVEKVAQVAAMVVAHP